MKFILKILLAAGAIYAVPYILDQVTVVDFTTALLAALVLGVLNVTIKPVIKLLTLPINILTLGLFGLVLNAMFLYLVTFLIEGFEISGFIYAILASLLISLAITLLELIFGIDD